MRRLCTRLFQELIHRLIEQDATFLHEDDVRGETIELTEDMAGDEDEFPLLLFDLLLENIG